MWLAPIELHRSLANIMAAFGVRKSRSTNSLQWVVCLLHTNELPFRHVLAMLDSTTESPDSFSGPFGKSLIGDISSWPVAANFSQTHILYKVARIRYSRFEC